MPDKLLHVAVVVLVPDHAVRNGVYDENVRAAAFDLVRDEFYPCLCVEKHPWFFGEVEDPFLWLPSKLVVAHADAALQFIRSDFVVHVQHARFLLYLVAVPPLSAQRQHIGHVELYEGLADLCEPAKEKYPPFRKDTSTDPAWVFWQRLVVELPEGSWHRITSPVRRQRDVRGWIRLWLGAKELTVFAVDMLLLLPVVVPHQMLLPLPVSPDTPVRECPSSSLDP
jgi:hypothetical protein